MKKLDQQYKERLRNAGKFTFIEMQKERERWGGERLCLPAWRERMIKVLASLLSVVWQRENWH